ncbi:tip120 [Anaeramoeba flamelloides]|uniref:Tip120 n=1 Tax=Anaeramoeba flamelloides TaxID=1746091 RepID=A0AAV7YY26_9EUKA|nr:tip120 [Anaeramoeba flamelloides]
MSSFAVDQTLDKMNNNDHDIRYMAVNDLITQVKKENFKLDTNNENQLINKMLQLVEDSSGNVQNLTVECFGLLISKISENQVKGIARRLTTRLLSEDQEAHDISALALRKVVGSTLNEQTKLNTELSTQMIPQMLKGIDSSEFVNVQLECIQIITDLIIRFNTLFVDLHEKIKTTFISKLTAYTAPGRIVEGLTQLSAAVNQNSFNSIIEEIIKKLESDKEVKNIRIYIQTISSISRLIGYRLGSHLKKLVPLILVYVEDDKYKEDDELRDNCLHSFESFVLRCPKEVGEFVTAFTKISLKLINYDPFYGDDEGSSYSGSESGSFTDESYTGSGSEGEDSFEEFQDDDDDEISDEEDLNDVDDVSWKVRKASAKCLTALVSTRPEQTEMFYLDVVPVLIKKFDEHEESVKLTVFETFIKLIKQTKIILASKTGSKKIIDLLGKHVEKIISTLAKQFGAKSLKVKVAIFTILNLITQTFDNVLDAYAPKLLNGIKLALNDKSSSNTELKLSSLSFFKSLLKHNSPESFYSNISKLIPDLINAIKDPYYKIAASALKVGSVISTMVRPKKENEVKEYNWKQIGTDLHSLFFEILQDQSLDQEVKEAVIIAISELISNLGDVLPDVLKTLNMLLERLSNEITRVVCIQAFRTIAESKVEIPLPKIIVKLMSSLAQFLRQKNRLVKQSSLRTMRSIVEKYGNTFNKKTYQETFSEMSRLVSDDDLHLAHLSLRLSANILKVKPEMASLIIEKIIPKVVELVSSPILQGIALKTTLWFYKTLITTKNSSIKFNSLIQPLYSVIKNRSTEEQLPKQAYLTVSQTIATLAIFSSEDNCEKTVNGFMSELSKKKTHEPTVLLALYALGEIGSRKDLSSFKNLTDLLIGCFDAKSELISSAASYALGNVAAGCLDKFLSVVIEQIKNVPKHQYLLFRSLKEIISRISESETEYESIKKFIPSILDLLFANCENKDESTRNVVSECLGKLALFNPMELIPELKKKISTKSVFTRATIVGALKFAIHKDKTTVDKALKEHFHDFIIALEDENHTVRLSALKTLNFASQAKPHIVQEELVYILPRLYKETQVKQELIKIVKFGQLVHVVDSGVENRKSAFDTMNILLSNSYNLLEPTDFVVTISNGFTDGNTEVLLAAHSLMKRMIRKNSEVVRAILDSLIEPLKKTITHELKKDADKQDLDENEQKIFSALRVVFNLSMIPDTDKSIKFTELINNTIQKNTNLASKYEAIVDNRIPDPDQSTLEYSTTSYF